MVLQNSILGGPRPDKLTDPELLNGSEEISQTTTLKTECGCNSSPKQCSCSKDKNIGECFIKIAVVLSVFVAGYLLIKK